MAPRRNGRGLWGCAPACCGGLCESVPSPTLAVRRQHVTKDGSPTYPPGFAYGASTTRLKHEAASCGRGVSAWRWSIGLAASGYKPVKPSRGDVESAMSPFGSGRPVRPWSVVNPGEGTAAPWASWPQPSSANNFPAAARLPREANCLRFQVLHGVATAARCGPPNPRRPDHNKDALARSCSTRKENHHG